MFKNKSEVEKIVNSFCSEKNIKKTIFEISTFSKSTGEETND